MQLISCHSGQLQWLSSTTLPSIASPAPDKSFRSGLAAIDLLSPGQAFVRGAVHELLTPSPMPSMGRAIFPALILARAAAWVETQNAERRMQNKEKNLASSICTLRSALCAFGSFRPIICCDPAATLYPPAVAALGIPLDQFYLLHPTSLADQTWAIAECLRCPGVAAVVATASRLSRVQARRLQLAAERGGAVGILLRPAGNASSEYAAATRWLVTPAPGERTVQRWKMQLIHGHGGLVGQAACLEHHRDTTTTIATATNPVPATEPLVHRPGQARTA